jgi:hypothetical protein
MGAASHENVRYEAACTAERCSFMKCGATSSVITASASGSCGANIFVIYVLNFLINAVALRRNDHYPGLQ